MSEYLAGLTGKPLFDAIRANQKRLDVCPRHNLEWPATGLRLNMKLRCNVCGAYMNFDDAASYVRGYIAAGGNPDDVAPWWNQPLPKED